MSAIEWTDVTWNPTTGCDRVSPGCDHCYAMTLAPRLKAMGSVKYQRDGDSRTSGPGFGISEHPAVLEEPLRWRKPRRVFVNSMSDLFHDGVSDQFIDHVFGVMAVAHLLHGHTFQVLTKRHGRMRSYLNSTTRSRRESVTGTTRTAIAYAAYRWAADRVAAGGLQDEIEYGGRWPLPGVWLGVSVEDQKRADLRVPALLDTPAAVRFLSCEPLLGPVDLTGGPVQGVGTQRQHAARLIGPCGSASGSCMDNSCRTRIDWVIAGGESGREARPMHPDWPRKLRDDCSTAGVSFFFKQWGEYGLLPRGWKAGTHDRTEMGVTVANDGTVYQPGDLTWPDGPRTGEAIRADHGRAHLHAMYRVGKKEAGRELDGRTWDEFPVVAS